LGEAGKKDKDDGVEASNRQLWGGKEGTAHVKLWKWEKNDLVGGGGGGGQKSSTTLNEGGTEKSRTGAKNMRWGE